MAHFAEVRSDNNKVIRVIFVGNDQCEANGGEDSEQCEQWVKDFHPNDPILLENEFAGTYGETYWKRTSYWTVEGVRTGGVEGQPPFRKNYAGYGFTYSAEKDAFIPPSPYTTWVYNEDKGIYLPPINEPSVKKPIDWAIIYDEANIRWLARNGDIEEAWNEATSAWEAI
jgi:hypothetical protein